MGYLIVATFFKVMYVLRQALRIEYIQAFAENF